jgi:hypothetical protein
LATSKHAGVPVKNNYTQVVIANLYTMLKSEGVYE